MSIIRVSYLLVSNSVQPWRARSCVSPTICCWTNPLLRWTRRFVCTCDANCYGSCVNLIFPLYWLPTIRRRLTSWSRR